MKNWRTTIIGALLAGVTFLAQFQNNGGNLTDWKLWLVPLLVAVLGYVAKDAGVSGPVKVLLASLCLLSLASCSLTPEQKATLTANAIKDGDAALLGYLQGGKAGAIAGLTAQEVANIKARQAAKNPVNVTP